MSKIELATTEQLYKSRARIARGVDQFLEEVRGKTLAESQLLTRNGKVWWVPLQSGDADIVFHRMAARLVFSLKGWNMIAQGNAVGMRTFEQSSLLSWDSQSG
jgi:hypothetical protein